MHPTPDEAEVLLSLAMMFIIMALCAFCAWAAATGRIDL